MANEHPAGDGRTLDRASRVLASAASLIRLMRFDKQVGDYLEGNGLFVRATPEWVSANSMSLRIACHASEPVTWFGMPVFVLPEGRDEVAAVATLDEQGQAFLGDLEPGEYRLLSSHIFGRMSTKAEMGGSQDGRVMLLPWTDANGRVHRIQAESREEPLRGARILLVTQSRMRQVLGSHTLTLESSPRHSGWLVGEESLETDRLAADPDQEFVFCVIPQA
jgi:hypothetical protein